VNRNPSFVALIPARSGSIRIADKNVRRLGAHPQIAYTIAAARASGVFDRVIVSTNAERTASIASHYGAEVPFLRPDELAGPTSPDIEWVVHALENLDGPFDVFSILRPTSPFRLPETIRRARDLFLDHDDADSLRAVESCRRHPAKMWTTNGPWLLPVLGVGPGEVPWHSVQYQSLPAVYEQNGSLELAWTRVVEESRSISGTQIIAFVTEGLEGFDVNWPEDWYAAERMLELGVASLPEVEQDPYDE
jgi:CMP-N,N'-diacetyllegionaminic acid synthase